VNPIGKIMVVVDPTADRQPAVAKAAVLAGKFNARVELFACDTKALRDRRLAAGRLTEQTASIETLLNSLAAQLRAQALEVTLTIKQGNTVHASVLEHLQLCDADLVVKDTHHHSIARRTFLTNTDWQLIRGCPAPLLLVKNKPWPERNERMQLVAAVDIGHVNDKPILLDDRILEYGAALGKVLAGNLHVVHAYLPATLIAAGTISGQMPVAVSDRELAKERTEKTRALWDLARSYDVPMGNAHAALGSAADQLPQLAQQLNADVVVMGAISRRALQRIFLGSTAEDVLEHLPCDVLVVKPINFAELLPF
jgi:universal stress protein E